jgi:hypothetical protein
VNEPDPAARRAAIATIWAPGGVEFLEAGPNTWDLRN